MSCLGQFYKLTVSLEIPGKICCNISITAEQYTLQSAPSGDVQHQTAFKMFMDAGRWYLFFYNDDNKSQTVSFVATEHGENLILFVPPHCSLYKG